MGWALFCGVKNTSKNDENCAFWHAPGTIHKRRSGFQTGVQNRAKWHQNAFKITAKWARKEMASALAMVKNARRRLTCENASKRVHFWRSRCSFAHAMDEQIVTTCTKFTTKWLKKYDAKIDPKSMNGNPGQQSAVDGARTACEIPFRRNSLQESSIN